MYSFKQTGKRQQIFIVVCGATFLAALYWFGLWLPVHQKLDSVRTELRQETRRLAVIDLLTQEYNQALAAQAANSNIAPPTATASLNLTAIIDQSLQNKTFQPSRTQQIGNDEIRLRVDAADFQQLTTWFAELEAQAGLVISSLNLAPGQNGAIAVNLTLTR